VGILAPDWQHRADVGGGLSGEEVSWSEGVPTVNEDRLQMPSDDPTPYRMARNSGSLCGLPHGEQHFWLLSLASAGGWNVQSLLLYCSDFCRMAARQQTEDPLDRLPAEQALATWKAKMRSIPRRLRSIAPYLCRLDG
jgi:hypothetical protein